MALEQIKTQVLLLHSQQSTLDTLSAGFGDRYAVHCATSGSEALNTLGSTPIHVIVSAQDLPGMSGLEALREARKRSPDTIGILLAGDADADLEALVGDQEVFQVVRGDVTPESLLELVESARRRARLVAISESANDRAANVDEPGEHIVMETSDTGASIVRDGGADLRALGSRQQPISPVAGGDQVDVLVLTKDEDFLATIVESSGNFHKVHHAGTPAQAETLVREQAIGVLVTDAAMAAADIETITEKLRKSVPRLVAIVAGRRDDGELLMDLINRGRVYRFLLKPVSPGRARLAIEASVKHHLEAPDSAFGGKSGTVRKPQPKAPASRPEAANAPPAGTAAADSPPAAPDPADDRNRTEAEVEPAPTTAQAEDGENRKGPLIAAVVTAVAALAAIGWWLTRGDTLRGLPQTDVTPEAVTEAAEPSPSVTESDLPSDGGRPVEAVPAPAYQPFLDQARNARAIGAIVTPPGGNAIERYVAAREIAPDDEVIATELSEAVAEGIGIVETALLERRVEEAAAALDVIRLAEPDSARLPFLDAQVANLRLRTRLERARTALREQRFEDAANALQAAEELAGADQPEIADLREQLSTARSRQEIDEVLGLANQRLDDGALTQPPNDNARYYFELALSTDPENAVAQQGLTLVAGRLVLRARDAIDGGELDQAAVMLEDAAALDPRSSDLAAAVETLNAARAEEEARRQAEEEQRLEEQRLAAEEAERRALAEAAAQAELSSDEAAGMDAAGDIADTDGARPDAIPTDRSFATPGRQAAGEATASTPAPAQPVYVPISDLTRTNYVAPRYPRSAQRRNITGWADVSFLVTQDGQVGEVEILDSSPGDVFDEAAMEAISQWRFEPPLDDAGRPISRRVAVRLAFSLE